MSRDAESLWKGEWVDRDGGMEEASKAFCVTFAKVFVGFLNGL